MTPAEALAAATKNGAYALGMADSLGAASPGHYADLVAIEGDPLTNVDCIIHSVRWVMKNGKVVVDHTRSGQPEQ
jgi:imidazolonepropionase-like amidohydrolase